MTEEGSVVDVVAVAKREALEALEKEEEEVVVPSYPDIQNCKVVSMEQNEFAVTVDCTLVL